MVAVLWGLNYMVAAFGGLQLYGSGFLGDIVI